MVNVSEKLQDGNYEVEADGNRENVRRPSKLATARSRNQLQRGKLSPNRRCAPQLEIAGSKRQPELARGLSAEFRFKRAHLGSILAGFPRAQAHG
jgi:hypothetical protein